MTFVDQPLVSVIIPCYNSEDFVEEAVRSALNQTHPRLEIIAVDDGSSDRTLRLLEGFAPDIVIIRQPNSGAPRARNVGLRESTGQFIQFLDADDILLPTKIEECLQEFTPELDIVFCDYIDEDASRPLSAPSWSHLARFLRTSSPAWDPTNVPSSALRVAVQTNSPLFRKQILLAVGGWDESLRNNQDIELVFRLAVSGARFKRIDSKLVRVRSHDSPSRIRLRPDRFKGFFLATEKMEEQARDAGIFDAEIRQSLSNRYAKTGRLAYQAGDRELAREAFARARVLSRRPRSTSVPLYNAISDILGLENTERLANGMRLLARR